MRDDRFFDAGSSLYRRDDYTAFISNDAPLLSAEHEEEDGHVTVQWPEHSTTFDASWLRAQDTSLNDPTPDVVPGTRMPNYPSTSIIRKERNSWRSG